MSKIRLAMIGCGAIADFHALAFREAGFELAAVCSRPGSPRIRPFAERQEIPIVFDRVTELLSAGDCWDAILIGVSVEPTIEVLELAMQTGAPILVEKPVGFRSSDLQPLLHRELPALVAYNRRFYRSVKQAKIEVERRPPMVGHMIFPQETITPQNLSDDPMYLASYFSSVTIHGLDMARYIFGDLKVQHVQQLRNDGAALVGICATLTSENGSCIEFIANFRAPSNFSAIFDWPDYRFEMKPLEVATIYEGMEVVEPTSERPMRTYQPKVSKRIDMHEIDYRFKPGFVRQAIAFANYVREGDPGPMATLEDAHAALVLAEQLAGETYPARLASEHGIAVG